MTTRQPNSTIDDVVRQALDEVLGEVVAIVNARLLELVEQLKRSVEARP